MRLVIIADTHTMHEGVKLPPGDTIIHAGDITGNGSVIATIEFLDWFTKLNYKYKIFVAGNHDWLFESSSGLARSLVPQNINYLEDSGVTIEGLNFWGIPYTKPFCNWAFNREPDILKEHWDLIPNNIDILITHGAPYKVLDLANGYNSTGDHTGDRNLYDTVMRIKPKLHCYGHIHEAYGQEEIDGIKFVNASVVNEKYELVNDPIIIDI